MTIKEANLKMKYQTEKEIPFTMFLFKSIQVEKYQVVTILKTY